MNTKRFYELIDVAGPLPSATNAGIDAALRLLPSGHPARAPLLDAAASNSKVGLRIQDLRDWGAESFGDPARNMPDPRNAPPVQPPRPPSTVKLPRLKGEALRRVLRGDHVGPDGRFYVLGVSNYDDVIQYVQAYSDGGYYRNALLSELAQMSDEQFAQTAAKYATPQDWLTATNRRERALDVDGKRLGAWADINPYIGK